MSYRKALNYPFTLLQITCLTVSALAIPVMAGAKPEYSAAEARKHIGETATVTGRVECVDQGRTYELLGLDGCLAKAPFQIVLRCSELNGNELKGRLIAVSGKIERFQDSVQIVVTSKSQIIAHNK